jgi:hypothetical protein
MVLLERLVFQSALPRIAGLMQALDHALSTLRLLADLQRPAYVSRAPRLTGERPAPVGD